jgi:hypothetical protein
MSDAEVLRTLRQFGVEPARDNRTPLERAIDEACGVEVLPKKPKGKR